MSNKGRKLNNRVWSLFETAGFQTSPNSNDISEKEVVLPTGRKRTVDLWAAEPKLDVKVIGENTTAADLRGSFTKYIHDLEALKNASGTDGGLLVLTGKEVSGNDITYAKQKRITVWGEDELRYFEAVADAIGEYCKYEIINSLGIKTKEEINTHIAVAIKLCQPHSSSKNDLFMFTMTPDKLLKTCVIYRKAQGSGDAYQRMLRKSRLGKIRKFVSQSDSVLPPNIIVHFGEDVTWEALPTPSRDAHGRGFRLTRERDYQLVLLRIPMAYASIELIDGQHRLYGFVGADAATRENFNLVVLGMQNLPFERRRDTFVSINDNSRRMDANLVAYLKYTVDEQACQKDNELMAIRIAVELNRMTPFKNKIKLLDVGDQKITLKGFLAMTLKDSSVHEVFSGNTIHTLPQNIFVP